MRGGVLPFAVRAAARKDHAPGSNEEEWDAKALLGHWGYCLRGGGRARRRESRGAHVEERTGCREGESDHVVVGRAGGGRREEVARSRRSSCTSKKYPNVTIKTVLQTTNGLVPAFKAAAAAKKGPDLQYFWGGIWSLEDAWAGSTKAVSDYIPQSELKHYLNTAEDTYDGKVWTARLVRAAVVPGALPQGRAREGGGGGAARRGRSCSSACDKLNAKGITPLAGGISDGWFGGWLYSIIGAQGVSRSATCSTRSSGKQKFTDPKHAAWWTRLQELRDHKCWNKDINSLELYQGQQQWVARQGGDDDHRRLGREEVRHAGRASRRSA